MELNQRQERIRQLLSGNGRLNVGQLAARLKVAAMTIRRDLSVLQQAGLLTRTHGGCVLQSPFVTEASFPDKQRRHQAHKAAIARQCVRRLKHGQAVYLDTGTTALAVARALPPNLALRVFTNNLRVAMELFSRSGVQVIVYGGVLAARNPDLIDEIALAHMSQFRLDVAIVGGDALDLARGEFYAADLGSAALSLAAQRQADCAIAVLDSSKFGRRSLALAGRLTRGVTLITDNLANPADLATLRKTGAHIVRAGATAEPTLD